RMSDQNVAWRDVAMDDARALEPRDGGGELGAEGAALGVVVFLPPAVRSQSAKVLGAPGKRSADHLGEMSDDLDTIQFCLPQPSERDPGKEIALLGQLHVNEQAGPILALPDVRFENLEEGRKNFRRLPRDLKFGSQAVSLGAASGPFGG